MFPFIIQKGRWRTTITSITNSTTTSTRTKPIIPDDVGQQVVPPVQLVVPLVHPVGPSVQPLIPTAVPVPALNWSHFKPNFAG